MGKRTVMTAVSLSLIALASPVRGVPTAEDGWLAFQGCWRAADAEVNTLLCIVPAGAGVRLVELADGKVVRESQLLADGRDRPISQEDCTGRESASWSDDRRRLYLNTRMTCGTEIGRNSTGLFALISAREWVSIHAIAVDNEAATRTVHYTLVDAPAGAPESIVAALRANRLARETARYHASSALTLADIQEACTRVHGRAVEAFVFARKQPFDLEGKELLALLDAGVPTYLVDALVAISNPQRFAIRDASISTIERERADRGEYDDRGYRGRYCDDYDYWHNRYCDRYYGRYSPFGYYSRYDDWDYGYRSPPVVVIVDGDGDQDKPVRPHGRATRRGYTNGSASNSSSRDTDRSTTSTRSSDTNGSNTRSGSGSSSTSSKSSSTSSGSSSSDRGKAKPRGGDESTRSSDTSSSNTRSASASSSTSSGSSSTSSSTSSGGSSTSSSTSDRGKAKPRGGDE